MQKRHHFLIGAMYFSCWNVSTINESSDSVLVDCKCSEINRTLKNHFTFKWIQQVKLHWPKAKNPLKESSLFSALRCVNLAQQNIRFEPTREPPIPQNHWHFATRCLLNSFNSTISHCDSTQMSLMTSRVKSPKLTVRDGNERRWNL